MIGGDYVIDSVSGQLQGTGTFLLSGLVPYLYDAPFDGCIMWRFAVNVWVESYNSNIIWNQISAGVEQLRGGRVVFGDRQWTRDEMFIDRRFNQRGNFTYCDTDADFDPAIGVGTGAKSVYINTSSEERYIDRIYYGLEPGVKARIFILGVGHVFFNLGNRAKYVLSGVVSS